MKNRILVVDDDASFRCVMEQLLKEEGYRVSTAENGTSALRALEREEFEVLISDIHMPLMNGIELFHNVKLLYPSLPVIFISGFTHPEQIATLLQEGASYVIRKPFDFSLLKSAIKTVLKFKETIPGKKAKRLNKNP